MSGTQEKDITKDPGETACREAFDYYDWNKSGSIPFSVMLIVEDI